MKPFIQGGVGDESRGVGYAGSKLPTQIFSPDTEVPTASSREGSLLTSTRDATANVRQLKSLTLFRGSFVSTGEIRRVLFEARDLNEAIELAHSWNVGVEFEVPGGWGGYESKPEAECEAYSLKEACRLLGGVSPITVYRWVVQKKLDRVPATRKVLITRRSIQRLVASRR